MLLKFLRNEKGVTQNDVANAIGVARYTYAKWEQGRAEPCILDIIKLLNYFDCTFEDLVGETNNTNIESSTKTKLNEKQIKLLSSFNLLSEDDQNKVLGYVSALLR
ncbi:MAG: helix-turn-helix transcriptional regulator [Clostridia bacterium]|nr:helix-turn-helix transcriptional regulator [Clostridia bacterium]